MKHELISQKDWQRSMSSLFAKIDLLEFLKFIDFQTLQRRASLPICGELFEAFEFPRVEGLPEATTFYKDIAGFRKGTSIPPHGHNHLVSSFLVLTGELHGRHFDRISDDGEFIHLRRSSDELYRQGDFSTISQHKDNVHWFTAVTDNAFIFDFGVGGLKSSGTTVPFPNPNPLKKGRIYLDVDRPSHESSDGVIRCARMEESDAYDYYG